MKKFYVLLIILVYSFHYLDAQTVTVTGSCFLPVDGDYLYDGDINGKPSFFHDTGSSTNYVISWTGTRWELASTNDQLGCHNDLDTPNPPATSLAPWTPDSCNPTGVFTGDGTSTTLSVDTFKFENLKIYPNPSSDYVTVSGIKEKQDYDIINIFGVKLLKGIVSENEKIDIRNLPKGLYLLRLEDRQAIKIFKN